MIKFNLESKILGRNVFLLVATLLFVSGCTEPGKTTAVGAATGGVLGAGLGAIVGNQTGDPATGLTIGALAGASAGGLVGNALEAEENEIRTQDEAIERQDRTIRAQTAELQELRRSSGDASKYASAGASRAPGGTSGLRQGNPVGSGAKYIAEGTTEKIREHEIPLEPATEKLSDSRARMAANAKVSATESFSETSKLGSELGGESCQKASREVARAHLAEDPNDRVFYFRRAVRLCPTEAEYQLGLGRAYKALGKKEDAVFALKEAVRLNSALDGASEELANLESSSLEKK